MIFWNSSGIFMLRSICQGGGYHLKVNKIKGNPPVPKETKLPLRLFFILRRQGFSINVQIHYELILAKSFIIYHENLYLLFFQKPFKNSLTPNTLVLNMVSIKHAYEQWHGA